MKNLALFVLSVFNVRNLGACSLCMQISFSAMIVSWIFLLGAMHVNVYMAVVFTITSTILTILWIGHIFYGARRSLLRASSSDSALTVRPQFKERREALRTFGQALVGAAAVSVALPLTLRSANAQTSQNTNDDASQDTNIDSAQDADGATILSACGQRCSRSNDRCPSGCICWWELGKCVKFN